MYCSLRFLLLCALGPFKTHSNNAAYSFPCVFDPNKYIWFCAISHVLKCVHLSASPCVCFALQKLLNLGLNLQIVGPNIFTPVVDTSTHGCYHFTPCSVTLLFAWGFKISTKQNLLGSFSHTSQLLRIKCARF